MNVKIIFFNWGSFYGKLIRFATKSNWSHVGIIGNEDTENYTVYEALDNGLVKNSYNKKDISDLIKKNKVLIRTIKVDKDCNLSKCCDKYIGKPYDWLTIFNIGFYFVFRRYALKYKGPRYLICSEFVARVLYDLGLNLSKILNKPYDYITPADIEKYIESKYITKIKKNENRIK